VTPLLARSQVSSTHVHTAMMSSLCEHMHKQMMCLSALKDI